MVNSLELILGEISKAEVKLGKNTGRVALNLFEYQEVIELSFNGHKSLQAYDHYCESLLQRLKDQIDERLAEVDARQVVVQDINLLIYEVTSQEKRYFPRKCPEDWFLKLQFQIRHQKEQFRDEVVRESILRYIKLQQRLLERAKELLRHRKSFLKNSSRAVSDTTRRSTPPLVSDQWASRNVPRAGVQNAPGMEPFELRFTGGVDCHTPQQCHFSDYRPYRSKRPD